MSEVECIIVKELISADTNECLVHTRGAILEFGSQTNDVEKP